MIRKLAASIFKFFASLQLATFLLLALGLIFAIGTFVESAYGTEAAKMIVYESLWMSVLLILLALNLAAAALNRLPWRQKHAGFVITHLGIIMILMGSLITRAYGIEGQVAITEGKTENRMIVNEPMLQIFSEASVPIALFEIRPHPFPWKGKESLDPLGFGGPVPKTTVFTYFPKSSRKEEIRESKEGPAALEVTLQSSFMKQNHWLVLDDSTKNEIQLGPAELRFSRELMPDQKNTPKNESGFLEFQFKDSKSQIQVPDNPPKKFQLEGTSYQVTIVKIYKDAMVDQNKLIDQSNEWKNPAAELFLEGNGVKEKHTVFSKFPDFPTFHGMKPSAAGVKIYFHRSDGQPPESKNELRFVWKEGALPIHQVRTKGEISQGAVKLGEEYSTGWMDFKFRIKHYYPHAEIHSSFKPEPVNNQAEDHLSSIEVELEKGGEKKSLWLEQGGRAKIELAGQVYQVVYGLRTVPLGFRLQLRDFRVENYPGTNRPASFESDVTLEDDFTGTARGVNIRMNHPLKYRGYKVFQSGYQELPGQPQVSIFSVAKDPGIPMKYAGALVLIGGILTMFYTRRFSSPAKHKIRKSKTAVK